MKILIDECIPRKFKRNLSGHDCLTVPEAALAGTENGQLLSLADERGFEVFLTIDRGFEYEQNLSSRSIAVMIVRAKSNRMSDLLRTSQRVSQHFAPLSPGDSFGLASESF
jgi:hypothetical protein